MQEIECPLPCSLTHHWLEGDVAVLLEGGLALLLGGRPVVGDVGHVALLLVAVVALDGAVVLRLPNLQDDAWKAAVSDFMSDENGDTVSGFAISANVEWLLASEICNSNEECEIERSDTPQFFDENAAARSTRGNR